MFAESCATYDTKQTSGGPFLKHECCSLLPFGQQEFREKQFRDVTATSSSMMSWNWGQDSHWWEDGCAGLVWRRLKCRAETSRGYEWIWKQKQSFGTPCFSKTWQNKWSCLTADASAGFQNNRLKNQFFTSLCRWINHLSRDSKSLDPETSPSDSAIFFSRVKTICRRGTTRLNLPISCFSL